MADACAALAQPEPEMPTDDQLIEEAIAVRLAFQPQDEVEEVYLPFDAEEPLNDVLVAFARAVLALAVRPVPAPAGERQAAPVPVPVSEQPWEREGWCDGHGRCWWTAGQSTLPSPAWWLVSIPQACTGGVMLPAHALPIPTTTPAGQEGADA